MLVQKVLDVFDILQDKYGAPYFPDEWKVDMLNLACNEYLNRLTPDNQGGVANFEQDTNVISNIQPLIYSITVSVPSNGLVTIGTINTSIQTATGDPTTTVHRYMSLGLLSGGKMYPVRYVKQNNLYEYQNNVFKRPRVPDGVVYTMMAGGLQFYPVSTTTPITVTVIKTPRVLTVSDVNIQVEFRDYAINQIIMIMLQYAGVSTRDVELEQDIRMAQVSQ